MGLTDSIGLRSGQPMRRHTTVRYGPRGRPACSASLFSRGAALLSCTSDWTARSASSLHTLRPTDSPTATRASQRQGQEPRAPATNSRALRSRARAHGSSHPSSPFQHASSTSQRSHSRTAREPDRKRRACTAIAYTPHARDCS